MTVKTIIATILALGSFALAQDNLITNPSFEEKAGDKPKGWHAQAIAATYISDGKEGDTAHTGTGAVKLANPTDFHQRWAVNNPMMIEVEGGQTIKYSAWVKAEGFGGKQFVQLRIEQLGADGKLLPKGEGSMFVQGQKHRPDQGKWTAISDELTLHADARKVRPLLVLASGSPESTATATFDDVELSKKQ